MNLHTLNFILQILQQIWWPVKISYQTEQINWISEELIRFHIQKIENLIWENADFKKHYNISDTFSLYMCVDYLIKDLWPDEFSIVTWEDLYTSGYKTLIILKQFLLIQFK